MLGRSWILTPNSKQEILTDSSIHVSKNSPKTWIHLTPRNEDSLIEMLKGFNIHPLTIEDIMNPLGRIKLEEFPTYTFVVFRGIHFDATQIAAKNFNFIMMKNLLITIALEHRNTIADIIMDWEKNKNLLSKGIEFILHRIFDAETDHILPIVYRIEDQALDFESRVYHRDRSLDISSVFQMRANLQLIKKNVNSHIELLKEVQTGKIRYLSLESDAFFRDVKDHSLRILEITENVKEVIASALEVHLTISSQKSNEIMTILTMMTAIMLPMSLIAGLYGMNFKHIPLLEDNMGFYMSLSFMGITGLLMFTFFKIKNWF